ncbi:unnamed protein product, partial [Mesorhabditis spiculigera]
MIFMQFPELGSRSVSTPSASPARHDEAFLDAIEPEDQHALLAPVDDEPANDENAAPGTSTNVVAQIKSIKEEIINNLVGIRFDVLRYGGETEEDLDFAIKANEQLKEISAAFARRNPNLSESLGKRIERDGPIREAAERFRAERLEHRATKRAKLTLKPPDNLPYSP